MKAYSIVEDRIMLRDHDGDLFEFKLVPDGERLGLRLVGLPSWKKAGIPKNAETRIDFARIAARQIARQNKMMG